MAHKEFLRLFESNLLSLDRLSDGLKKDPINLLGYPRQQVTVLVRLHLSGSSCLKDIARREHLPTPNLCVILRKLESVGLVCRTVDDKDRRNTWYSVTPAGEKIALAAMDKLRVALGILFANLSPDDEKEFIGALKTMNKILTKMELNNE